MIRSAYKHAKCHLKFVQGTKTDQNSSFWPCLTVIGYFYVRKYPISVLKYPDCSGSISKRPGAPENIPKPASTAFIRPKLTQIAHFGVFDRYRIFSSVIIRYQSANIQIAPEVLSNDSETPKTYPNLPRFHSDDQN